jgi:predicted nucleic acid-binding protein
VNIAIIDTAVYIDHWEIRRIGDARAWEIHKRREFQNDALIALTAARHGATVVTTNTRDFALLADAIKVTVAPL